MTLTIEVIQEKLEKIESKVVQLRKQFNHLLEQQMHPSEPEPIVQFVDKAQLRPLVAKAFKEMGIHGKPIGSEKVQEMIAAYGVKPEENLFSRGILEMREE